MYEGKNTPLYDHLSLFSLFRSKRSIYGPECIKSSPFYLVSYVSVPTSNLYVGGNLIDPSWKPSSTDSLPLAMFSCKTTQIHRVSSNNTSTGKNAAKHRLHKIMNIALCFFNALYKTVAPSSMAFNIFKSCVKT